MRRSLFTLSYIFALLVTPAALAADLKQPAPQPEVNGNVPAPPAPQAAAAQPPPSDRWVRLPSLDDLYQQFSQPYAPSYPPIVSYDDDDDEDEDDFVEVPPPGEPGYPAPMPYYGPQGWGFYDGYGGYQQEAPLYYERRGDSGYRFHDTYRQGAYSYPREGRQRYASPGPGHYQSPGPGHYQSPGPGHYQSPGAGHYQSPGPGHYVSPGGRNYPNPGHGRYEPFERNGSGYQYNRQPREHRQVYRQSPREHFHGPREGRPRRNR